MHCTTFAFSQYFMHFRCVLYMLKLCVLIGLDWVELMMLILLHVTCSCIFYAYIPFFSYFDIDIVWYSLSLSLSLSLIVCTWHPSAKLLHLGTLFVPRHHLLLILAFFMSGSVIIKPVRTFPRTFLGVAFTRNTRSFFLTSPILTFPLSFTIGVRGPFVISRLVVPP